TIVSMHQVAFGRTEVEQVHHALEEIVEKITLQEGILEHMVPLTEVVPVFFLVLHLHKNASPIWAVRNTLLIEDPIVLLLTHIHLVNGQQGRNYSRYERHNLP